MTQDAPQPRRRSALRDALAVAAGVAFGVALLALAFLLASRPLPPTRPLDACGAEQPGAPLTRACAKPVNRDLPRAFPAGDDGR